MDSTLKSNISVGLPLDLLVYEADTLRVTKFVHIDGSNQYMAMIRDTWGSRLKQVFAEIPDPTWFDSYVPPGAPRLQTEIGSRCARRGRRSSKRRPSRRPRCNWSRATPSEKAAR